MQLKAVPQPKGRKPLLPRPVGARMGRSRQLWFLRARLEQGVVTVQTPLGASGTELRLASLQLPYAQPRERGRWWDSITLQDCHENVHMLGVSHVNISISVHDEGLGSERPRDLPKVTQQRANIKLCCFQIQFSCSSYMACWLLLWRSKRGGLTDPRPAGWLPLGLWAGHVLIWSIRRNRLGSAYMLRSAKECGGALGRNNRPWSKGVDLPVTCMSG